MTIIAAAVRELMAAGITGEALIAAIERIELAGQPPQKTARQARNARYYAAKAPEWKAQRRLKTSEIKTVKTVSDGKAPLSPPPSSFPLTLPLLTTPDPSPPARQTRATRLADDWTPSEADLEFARLRGIPEATIDAEAMKFRNYWTAKGGKDAAKMRWDRTWQNWILNVTPTPNGKGPTPHAQSATAAAGRLAEAAARGEFTFAPRPTLGGVPEGGRDNPRLLQERSGRQP